MGGEDMSYFLEKVPGCFYGLGGGNEAKGINAPHHNSYFNIDEDCLAIGVECHLRILERYLGVSL
jgi:amidohydrolase